MRTYLIKASGKALRFSEAVKRPDVLRWLIERLDELPQLSSKADLVSVMTVDVRCQRIHMLLPHEASAKILVTYPSNEVADTIESKVLALLDGGPFRSTLQLVSDRPPMTQSKNNAVLAKAIRAVCGRNGGCL